MEKSLDLKLNRVRSGIYQPADFIIADAKDGDMGGGITAFGRKDDGRWGTFPEHLDAMRDITKSELVDIMLMSASAAERLVGEELFQRSSVTPAVRLNDTTDIWGPRHSHYKQYPTRNFRTARLDRIPAIVDLGLYSITFSNDLDHDIASLEDFHFFLDDLAETGVRYFLEVFNPQIDIRIEPEKIPEFVNDCIVRCLAGLTRADYPQFLKMPYNGPRAMEEIASYDPGHLIVGVLGGGAGTARDTFELVRQSEKYGARVALFGRKILFAEDSRQIVTLMRAVVEGALGCEEAVKAYHSHLEQHNIRAKRPLSDDLIVTEEVLKMDL